VVRFGWAKENAEKIGWYKGDRLQQWLGRLIQEKTASAQTTFMQLHQLAKHDNRYKDLYVTATNLTLQRLEIFSWQTFPHMPIVKAVRASASIPFYYEAVLMDSLGNTFKRTDSNCCVYADGGLLTNYPITIFNEGNDSGKINQFTLGLKLDRPEQISYYSTNNGLAPFKINSFKNYVAGLYNVTMEQLNPSVPHSIEKLHTIYISTGNMSPKVRHITGKQKKELYTNGVIAAEQFFAR
jgi:NTE family protein